MEGGYQPPDRELLTLTLTLILTLTQTLTQTQTLTLTLTSAPPPNPKPNPNPNPNPTPNQCPTGSVWSAMAAGSLDGECISSTQSVSNAIAVSV